MQDPKRPLVAATLSETLANLAYMFPDEDPAGENAGAESSGDWMEARISYGGPAAGKLCFRCTSRFAVKVAANLLGVEPDQTAARMGAEDAIGEFLNVLCGQVVSSLYETQEVFRLSVPDVKRLAGAPARADEEAIRMQVEGCPIELSFSAGEPCMLSGWRV